MNERKIGILLSYLNIVLHAVIGFVYVPLLLHYIGKSEYGLYQLIGSFIAYFSVMDFGLSTAVVRFYTKYKTLNDNVNMENILALALRAYGVIAAAMFAAGCVLYYYLPRIFDASMSAAELVSARKLFALLLFNIVAAVSTMIFRAVINAHEKFFFLKGLECVQLILQPLLVLLVLQREPGALAVAVAQTALNIALIAARIYYCFAKLRISIRFHYWDARLSSEFKKLAVSVFAVTLIDQVFFKTNQVILGVVSGTAAVAVYSVASLVYMNYMALSLAISGVYLPHITEMIAKGEATAKLSQLFVKVGRCQFYLLALVATGFIIFGRQFIAVWAGEGFEDAYWITLLIIVPFTVDLIQNIGLAIMQAQNRYDFRAKVYCIMGIFNLCLAVFLVEKYGGIGCAFATGLAMFLGNGLVMNLYYIKVTGLDIKRFWQEIAHIAAVVAVIAAVGYAVNLCLTSKGAAFLVGKILAYTTLYAAIVYKYCFNGDEKEKVRAAVAKIKSIELGH